MLSGRMNKKMDFYTKTKTKNEIGEVSYTKELDFTLWGVLKTDTTNPRYDDGENVEYQQTFTIRYDSRINYNYDLYVDGVEYELMTIKEFPRRSGLELLIRRTENG